MKNALLGHASEEFQPPEGVVFANIDPETGLRAGPWCPGAVHEAFLEGTEPAEYCLWHRQ